MRSKLTKGLAAFLLALSLGAVATSASAYQCRMVGGYWSYGRWHPAHRVCWGNGGGYRHHGCRWIPTHTYNGRFIPAHKQCW